MQDSALVCRILPSCKDQRKLRSCQLDLENRDVVHQRFIVGGMMRVQTAEDDVRGARKKKKKKKNGETRVPRIHWPGTRSHLRYAQEPEYVLAVGVRLHVV